MDHGWARPGRPRRRRPPQASSGRGASGRASDRSAEQRAFWSFQPLAQAGGPRGRPTPSWAKTDIDRFVLARLEREGLAPVGTADKRTLIRRATLDLTGLPPTAEEIEAFAEDDSPDAFAKVVDRLLASPHYGETWGRHWLDVARYAEDDPRSLDPMGRGYAPYPERLSLSRLGDQGVQRRPALRPVRESADRRRPPGRDGARPASARARASSALGPWYYDNGAVEITRADERHDRVDVVSRGFLGLTVACARCHDHKYDPIPQRDYYALAGVFLNTPYHEYPLAPKSVVDEYKAPEKKIKDKEKLLAEFLETESRQLAGDAGAAGVEVHAGGLEGARASRRRTSARVATQREARFRAVRSLGPASWRSRRSSTPT